jgi:hypothetical protein
MDTFYASAEERERPELVGNPMFTNDAFQEGYNAYWDGVDVSDNPHDQDTEERRSWEESWRAARKHDYDESEG